MDGMYGSAECVAPTRFYLDKDKHLTVLNH
jgi:hypothetical protein